MDIPQQQQIRVDISDAPWEKCECGGILLEESVAFKRLSALLSPTGQEIDVPVKIFLCRSCGKVPGFVRKKLPDDFPTELIATKNDGLLEG